MLGDKYKELNEELSKFNEESTKTTNELEREKKIQIAEFIALKDEIKSGKKYSKIGGRNWWFRIKLFFWRLLMSTYY